MLPKNKFIEEIITLALAEDIGAGDITSEAIFGNETAMFYFRTREDIIFAGGEIIKKIYHKIDKKIKVRNLVKDGDFAKKGIILAEVSGSVKNILAGERVALNFIQRMSGIASLTNAYVNEVKGTKAKIMDTRKTLPGHRFLDKYAVKIGGGVNQRMGLYDAVLIKDNHIAAAGGIEKAVAKFSKSKAMLEVECDNLVQVKKAIHMKIDRILLDNFSVHSLKAAVKLASGRIPLEASGGITLKNIRKIAETGVDFISVGALTHSVKNVDIGLDDA